MRVNMSDFASRPLPVQRVSEQGREITFPSYLAPTSRLSEERGNHLIRLGK